MENSQKTLKSGGKKMQSSRIFSVDLTNFILISPLILRFGILSVCADENASPNASASSKSDVPKWRDPVPLKLVPVTVNFDKFDEIMSGWKDVKIPDRIKPVVPIPSIGIVNVLTLLKTIQVELTALGNKPNEETQEIKSQNDEVNKEFADLLKDLKGQITSLSNQQKEIQTALESKNSSLPLSVLTDPQFYTLGQFRGTQYIPSSDDWKTKCVEWPFTHYYSSSVKTGGHCLLICPEKDCKGIFKSTCQKINGDVGNLKDIGFALNWVKSFRQC